MVESISISGRRFFPPAQRRQVIFRIESVYRRLVWSLGVDSRPLAVSAEVAFLSNREVLTVIMVFMIIMPARANLWRINLPPRCVRHLYPFPK